MGTFRDYICNECASAEGAMPRPIVGPLRGTATQRKNYATHLGSRPAKATNGVFNAPYHSTTAQRVIFDEAVANGAIEVESGDRNSTNLVMAIPSGVAQMESKGAAVGPATAFRVVNSSLSHEPHGYPVQLGPLLAVSVARPPSASGTSPRPAAAGALRCANAMWLRCLTTAFQDVADAMQIGDRHMLKKSTTVERGT